MTSSASVPATPPVGLEPGGEALDDPVLGEGQLGVGAGPGAGDVGQLLEQLDQGRLVSSVLHRAAGLERAGALAEGEAGPGPVGVALVLAEVQVDPAGELAAEDARS